MYRWMRRIITLMTAVLFLLFMIPECLAADTDGSALPYPAASVLPENRKLVATSDWEPPVIDESVKDTEPWMLSVKIAQEELGYTEGPLKDESKYGEWYAGKRVAWCAEFLTWCANEADNRYGTKLVGNIYPMYGRAKEGAPWFIARGRFVTDDDVIPTTTRKQWLIGSDHYLVNNEYIPFPGDYMWIAWYSPRQGTDHVAIIEGVSRDEDGEIQLHVIEGNNPDKVQRAVYPLSYKLIYGFGTPVRRAYTDMNLYDSSDDIYVLQKYLTAAGYLKERKTPRKELTRDIILAVKSYQRKNGLKETLRVDLETRELMMKDEAFQDAYREVYQQ